MFTYENLKVGVESLESLRPKSSRHSNFFSISSMQRMMSFVFNFTLFFENLDEAKKKVIVKPLL